MSNQRPRKMSSNVPLKIVSCILGYSLWSMLSQTYLDDLDIAVPVCLYNVPESFTIDAPETINLRLRASRAMLRTITHDQVALHIDGTTLHAGTNPLLVCQSSLFLPENVNVVHYTARPLMITLTEKAQPPVQSPTLELTPDQQNT